MKEAAEAHVKIAEMGTLNWRVIGVSEKMWLQ